MATRLPQQGTLGEDHIMVKSNIDVAYVTAKELVGDDGIPVKNWSSSGTLSQVVTYNLRMERLDGVKTLHMTWVDLDNKGNRFALPDKVIEAIVRAHASIGTKSRKIGARKAYDTRVANGDDPAENLKKEA